MKRRSLVSRILSNLHRDRLMPNLISAMAGIIVGTAGILHVAVLAGDLFRISERAVPADAAAVLRRMMPAAFCVVGGSWMQRTCRRRIERSPMHSVPGGVSSVHAGRLLSDFFTLFSCAAAAAGSLSCMLRLSLGTSAFVVLFTPVPVLAAARLARLTVSARKQPDTSREDLIWEILSAEKAVKLYGCEGDAIRRFRAVNIPDEPSSLREALAEACVCAAGQPVCSVVLAGAAGVGALACMPENGMDIGQLVSFLVCAVLYAESLRLIVRTVSGLRNVFSRA